MLVGLRLPVEQRKFRTLTALILERVRNAELKLAKPSLSLKRRMLVGAVGYREPHL